MLLPSLAIIVTSLTSLTLAATPAQWRSRSIYQVIVDRFAQTDGSTSVQCDLYARKYCGGTWRGLMNKLDYIQNMGFDALWISPIVQNIEATTDFGQSYHGYWTQNINGLNSHFGNESDLLALSAEVHRRGMYFMVDTIANHLAYPTTLNTNTFSTVSLSSYAPFTSKTAFHPTCQISYSNQTSVEQCWLATDSVALMDLNTEDATVVKTLYSWVANTVQKYSIDGIRLDAVKHIRQSFWPGFNNASGVFNIGEVFDGNPQYLCSYQNNSLDGLLNFLSYGNLIGAFVNNDMPSLVSIISTIRSQCKDPTLLGSFLENQDLARFRSYTNDTALLDNVVVYNFVTDGIPIIYYGFEQNFHGSADPINREAMWTSGYNTSTRYYKMITAMNKFRSGVINTDQAFVTEQMSLLYSDAFTLALNKRRVLSVYSNAGSSGAAYNVSFTVPSSYFPSGTTLVDILTNQVITVDSTGSVNVPLVSGSPRVYYPSSSLAAVSTATVRSAATSTGSSAASSSGSSAASASKKSSAPRTGSVDIRSLAIVFGLAVGAAFIL